MDAADTILKERITVFLVRIAKRLEAISERQKTAGVDD